MIRLLEFIKRVADVYLVGLGCRLILAMFFIYGGVTKIGEPQAFAEIIGAYGLLPDSMVFPAALVLPPLEIFAAIGLLFRVRGALLVVSGLIALFIMVLGYGLWLGLDIDCGCFEVGGMEHRVFSNLQVALWRDFLLLFPLGLCWFQERRVMDNQICCANLEGSSIISKFKGEL